MVMLKVKGKGENDVFIYETPVAASVDAVVRDVVEISNLRVRLRCYVTSGQELARTLKCDGLKQACEAAAAVISGDEALVHRRPCVRSVLEEHVRLIRGATTTANPADAGVSVDDLRKQLENSDEDSDDVQIRKQCTLQILLDDPVSADARELLDPATAVMWFASKQLSRDRTLADFLGRNEKTTALVKVTPTDTHPPVKEPPVDTQTQRDMMAFWFRKQEEEKRLKEDDDIHWNNSQWADPNAMRATFQGLKDLRIR